MIVDYQTFLESKVHLGNRAGFEPTFLPGFLFPFQAALVEWSVRRGRCAIFADCGLGKTPMQLVWAQNVVERTNRPVLILTPLAVASQTVREGAKFGLECAVSRDGQVAAPITVTNYQQIQKFSWQDFSGVVCDESSILKNFDGQIKAVVTEFMRRLPYRLLCTATAAPNDYIELGTSSEALGELGFMDMLGIFFKQANGVHFAATRRLECSEGVAVGGYGKYRFRGHAERDFWRWVCSWGRAVRRPSDLGFDDAGYTLPALCMSEHTVQARTPNRDYLFDLPAQGLAEQRAERRRTLRERCELAARLVANTNKPAVAWCHLNEEGALLKGLIPGAVEVSGSDSDEAKEEAFEAFASGQFRVLVSKPVIAGFGLNWQHCSHQTFFPSHSFEQWYQAVRRCWRFGQQQPVQIDLIASEGEAGVLANLKRKTAQADAMFSRLVELVNCGLSLKRVNRHTNPQLLPSWL